MNWRVIPLAAYLVLRPHFWLADALADAPQCRASLVTAIDTSASVSHDGLMLQLDGISAALRSPVVLSAIQSQGCARMAVFVWNEGPQTVLLPWTDIATEADAEHAAATLLAAAEAHNITPYSLTDVSGALEFARQMLGQAPASRQVVNIVSDGEDNVAAGPETIRAQMLAERITINAVLFGPSETIDAYYRANVTGGVGSFQMRVRNAGDFAASFRSKFVLDLS